MLHENLRATRMDCAALIAAGGADYDFDDVNPATVVRVITGDPSERVTRVVPKGVHECGACMLLMYSHGSAHPRAPPPRGDDENADEEVFPSSP